MTDITSLKLTPEQARVLWENVDGWLDAGACKDGLTEQENEGLKAVQDQLLKQIKKWRDAPMQRDS